MRKKDLQIEKKYFSRPHNAIVVFRKIDIYLGRSYYRFYNTRLKMEQWIELKDILPLGKK